MAENSYSQQWKQATVFSTTPALGLKAPAIVSGAIVAEIALGCSTCTANAVPQTDPNMAAYPFNPSSGGAGRSF